jgi:hypothetical protein
MALNNRRIEGSFSQGWPIAIFITALAVGSFVTAGLIHKRTFRAPTDVTAAYRKEKGAEHAPAAAGEHKEAAH